MSQSPALHRFGVALLLYGVVLGAAMTVLFVLAGLGGGAMGLSAALGILFAIALFLGPGAVLSALVVTWLGRGGRRPRRSTASWLSAAISALSLGAIYALVALNADPGPDPWTPFDQRPLVIFFSSVAGIIGLVAGHTMVALAEAGADASSPSH